MEKVTIKYEQFHKSLKAFERALEIFKKEYPQADSDYKETYVASVVKHYELLYETFWKYTKFYIIEKFGDDIIGSKNIFRFLQNANVISLNELDLLLEIIENRNATTHQYDQDFSLQIVENIERYFQVIKSVTVKILL